MNMVIPYLACQLLGGVLGAAMAKVNMSPSCFINSITCLGLFPCSVVAILSLTGDDLRSEIRQSPRCCVCCAAVKRCDRSGFVWRGCHDLYGHHGGVAGGCQRQDQKPHGAILSGLHGCHPHLGWVSKSTEDVRNLYESSYNVTIFME